MIELLPYRVEARITVTRFTPDRLELLAQDGYVLLDEAPAHSNPDALEWELRYIVDAVSEEAAAEWLRAECVRVGLGVLHVQALRLPRTAQPA